MPIFIKLLFLALIFSNQGCQIHFLQQDKPQPSPIENKQAYFDNTTPLSEIDATPVYTNEVYRLLMQGMQYHELNKPQQQEKCETLKINYQADEDWKIAWLLIYALNDDFACINATQSLDMLNKIQDLPDMNIQLKWLNGKHIKLLSQIIKSNKHRDKLAKQLRESKMKLQKESHKIEELKKIEANINKKIENE